jgi:RimJ/RimL family protein N-acetyltransferase
VDVEVRRIRADEGQRLRDVRLRALRNAPGAFSSTFEQSRHRPIAEWDDMAGNGSSGGDQAMFVAEPADGRGPFLGLAGGLAAESRPGSVQLISMWVDPTKRGAGVGADLVSAVVDWSRAGGAREVELWVVEGNEPAIALYRRCGFVATPDRQPYPNRPHQEELRMTLRMGDG